MSSKLRLINLDPNKIEIPPIRVTSVWDPEEYEVFKASLEADGQGQAIICVKEGEHWWLADGLHRLEEAKAKGWKRIAVAYKEGTLIDAKVRNLYMNRLRGKTKASEEVTLIRDLYENDGLDLPDIGKKTGIPLDLIERRLAIGRADPYVLECLDNERIGVGIAFELSRLPNEKGQVRLLQEILKQPRSPPTEWVKGIVDESLKILTARAKASEDASPIIPLRTIPCFFCDGRYVENDVRGVIACTTCAGLAKDYIKELMRKRRQEGTPEEALAKRIVKASVGEEPSPSEQPAKVGERQSPPLER